jgi:uncharacterized protein (TIGR02118 family)
MPVDVIVLYHPPSDPAAFDRYYETTHVPLAKAMPGLVEYEYSRGGVSVQGDAADVHLIARLRYASEADREAALASPEGAAAVADLANFADGGVTLLTAEVASA